MKLRHGNRRGIASVIGTIFFVLVLMAAIGALAYMSSVQAQSNQAAQQAQQVANMKGKENLQYAIGSSGLAVSNTGGAASRIVALLFEYPNGTVYNLNSGSTPPFTAVTIPTNANSPVGSMVPSGTCTPGTSTCVSRYNAIVANPSIGSIGLVTSLGNTYWSNPTSISLPNSCGGVGTLSMQVSPSGAGMTSPGSITEYCNGQQVTVEAFAAPGYTFSSWTGSGTGSYSGSSDPAAVTVNGLVTETANFVSGSGGPYPVGDPLLYMTTAAQTTTSTTWTPLNQLSFTGTANTPYIVAINLDYYQSAMTAPGISFGVHLPSGATVEACATFQYRYAEDWECTTSPDTPIGGTTYGGDLVYSANFCNVGPTYACVFAGTIYVMFGSTGGSFQLEWEVSSGITGTLTADSAMTVTPG